MHNKYLYLQVQTWEIGIRLMFYERIIIMFKNYAVVLYFGENDRNILRPKLKKKTFKKCRSENLLKITRQKGEWEMATSTSST